MTADLSTEEINAAWVALEHQCAAHLRVALRDAARLGVSYVSISAPVVVAADGDDPDHKDGDSAAAASAAAESSASASLSSAPTVTALRVARGEWRILTPRVAVRSVLPYDWPHVSDVLESWPNLWVVQSVAVREALALEDAARATALERTPRDERISALNWLYTTDMRWCALAIVAIRCGHPDDRAAIRIPMGGVTWLVVVPITPGAGASARARLTSGGFSAHDPSAPEERKELEYGKPAVWAFPQQKMDRVSLEFPRAPMTFDDAAYVCVCPRGAPVAAGRGHEYAFFVVASSDRSLWRRMTDTRP